MIQIIDPCEECVVVACCNQICNLRWIYTNKCNYQLKFFNDYQGRSSLSELEEYKKDFEEIRTLMMKINLRNEELVPHFSSSSCQSSGISISSSSTYDVGPGFDKKFAKKAAKKLAQKIDSEIIQSYFDKCKEAFGFHAKRKT